MEKLAYIVILLAACIASDTTSRAAGIRRMAEWRLKKCLELAGESISLRRACLDESSIYCIEQMRPLGRIEKGCGLGWN